MSYTIHMVLYALHLIFSCNITWKPFSSSQVHDIVCDIVYILVCLTLYMMSIIIYTMSYTKLYKRCCISLLKIHGQITGVIWTHGYTIDIWSSLASYPMLYVRHHIQCRISCHWFKESGSWQPLKILFNVMSRVIRYNNIIQNIKF